ncbi:MAG TPA: TetR/AcrR family transcriptional regulator, partial [Solirubrobacteraceae bacterium]|nr:TetR/AcrR family transcriptional regulator [Solirubrobacteraceae bacterium]
PRPGRGAGRRVSPASSAREPAPARTPGRPRSAEADTAILRATLDLLREEGFRALSVEAVRQRAGVGKATIYRRYPDKAALVKAALASLTPAPPEPPDTGSVRGDLLALFAAGYDAAPDRAALTAAPRLLADSVDEPELHALFRAALIEPRRAVMRGVLERGMARGEVARGADVELLIDLIAGPIIYRILIDAGELASVAGRLDALLDVVLRGAAP